MGLFGRISRRFKKINRTLNRGIASAIKHPDKLIKRGLKAVVDPKKVLATLKNPLKFPELVKSEIKLGTRALTFGGKVAGKAAGAVAKPVLKAADKAGKGVLNKIPGGKEALKIARAGLGAASYVLDERRLGGLIAKLPLVNKEDAMILTQLGSAVANVYTGGQLMAVQQGVRAANAAVHGNLADGLGRYIETAVADRVNQAVASNVSNVIGADNMRQIQQAYKTAKGYADQAQEVVNYANEIKRGYDHPEEILGRAAGKAVQMGAEAAGIDMETLKKSHAGVLLAAQNPVRAVTEEVLNRARMEADGYAAAMKDKINTASDERTRQRTAQERSVPAAPQPATL